MSNDDKIIEELNDPNFHNKFPSKEEMIKYQNKLVLEQLEKFENSQKKKK